MAHCALRLSLPVLVTRNSYVFFRARLWRVIRYLVVGMCRIIYKPLCTGMWALVAYKYDCQAFLAFPPGVVCSVAARIVLFWREVRQDLPGPSIDYRQSASRTKLHDDCRNSEETSKSSWMTLCEEIKMHQSQAANEQTAVCGIHSHPTSYLAPYETPNFTR